VQASQKAAGVCGIDTIAAALSPSQTRPAQPIVPFEPTPWGGLAVAWQRIDDSIRAGTKVSSSRYWLSMENVACVEGLSRSGTTYDVACGILFDTWCGVVLHAHSHPVRVPDSVVQRYWAGVDEYAGVTPPVPEAASWTFGRAALMVLPMSPTLRHDDWIGSPEVHALQDAGGHRYSGREAQLSGGSTRFVFATQGIQQPDAYGSHLTLTPFGAAWQATQHATRQGHSSDCCHLGPPPAPQRSVC